MATDRFDRQRRIEGWNQEVLKAARILVVGAGTTGNEVVKNLALVGIGVCDIVDNDLVEEVNLSRCALFRREDVGLSKCVALARQVAPLGADYAIFRPLQLNAIEDFGSARYADYSAVISAVDNLEARMWLNRYSRLNGVTFIDTAIGGLNWHVTLVPEASSACLECCWGQQEYQRLAERQSCSRIGFSPTEPVIPMVATTAAQVAGLAVEVLIRLLHGQQVNGAVRTWMRQGRLDSTLTWNTPEKMDCVAHRWCRSTIIDATCNADDSLADILAGITVKLKADQVELSLDRPVVYEAGCRRCGEPAAIRPIPLSRFSRQLCQRCGWLEVVPTVVSEVLRNQVSCLRDIGVPERHFLRLSALRGSDVREGWLRLQ